MPGPEKKGSAKTADKCALCFNPATSHCGGCGKVSYCSKEHQRKHWKLHKGDCCSWKVAESPHLGRYLVAVRDIKPGEVVLRERPLLLTPPKVTPPICLGCYREFNVEFEDQFMKETVTPSPCPKCGWPMCQRPECSNSEDHKPGSKSSEFV